jgi:type II secretory pathway component PulF
MDDEAQCKSSRRVSPPVVALIITHGIPLCMGLAHFWIVVPVFGEMFADFGASLPGFTQLMLDFSSLSKQYLPVTIMLVVALLFGDALLYVWLYRSISRRAGLLWFWGVFIAQLLQLPLAVVSMFLPIFTMGEVVQ